MERRQELSKNMDVQQFTSFYYLKEELIRFCKAEGLQSTGSKQELNERIVAYLTTGEKRVTVQKRVKTENVQLLSPHSKIEENFVCSEKHRAFFRQYIGDTFKFNVQFQKWLKANAGKSYQDAIDAYHQILVKKKENVSTIGAQFEYNTYIRDFFTNNQGKSLEDAICCWRYKKSRAGHNRYEKQDLCALEKK